MKTIQSIVLFFLCLSCIFLSFPYRTSAEEVPAPSLQGILVTALKANRDAIDVAACAIPVSAIGRLFADVLHEHPDLFHVGRSLSYRYGGDGRVLTVYPTYTLSGASLAAARHLYDATLATLCASVDPTWSEADRALAVHDLLAARYAYDTKENNYDALSLFRDGVGVCEAYAMAYMAVGRAVGLAVDLVYSDAMNHAWNHVRVDGAWYHVDVTRDDPVEGVSPVVRHSRLLRSDEGMASLGYADFTCAAGHICSSTRFENAEATDAGVLSAWTTVPRRVGEIWCMIGDDHGVTPISLSDTGEGVVMYAEGDINGDGAVTPEDILALRQMELSASDGGADAPFDIPCDEAVLARLRDRILDGMASFPDGTQPPSRMAATAARSNGVGSSATATNT